VTVQTLTNTNNRHYHSESIDASATGDPVMIRPAAASTDQLRKLLVAVVCESACTVEYSIDPFADVESEEASWIPWEPGEVSESKGAELPDGVTAVRCVNGGGSAVVFKVAC
jgi:hypothetical protein